ncbi:MAG: outer membrane lipoprotein-sorting protein [Firmicutes bacterium]|nr:outer membrane lipoprotein-sorting protein [Bacillota bacterium]
MTSAHIQSRALKAKILTLLRRTTHATRYTARASLVTLLIILAVLIPDRGLDLNLSSSSSPGLPVLQGHGLSLEPSVASASANADTGGLTADQILDRMKGNASLTGTGTATIELITENKRGQQRSNKLRVFRKEDPDGTEKQLLEYLSPADVAGTKFLSIKKEAQDSQMWLFLPALGRERRIAGAASKDKFMGTDFTYEEIGNTSSYRDDYKAVRLPDETLDSRKAYVLKLTPKQKSDYSLVKIWVWQDEFIPLRIEFYNLDNKLKKLLTNTDLSKNTKGEWQPNTITMSDVLGGTKTIIKLLETKEGNISDDYFAMRYLRR